MVCAWLAGGLAMRVGALRLVPRLRPSTRQRASQGRGQAIRRFNLAVYRAATSSLWPWHLPQSIAWPGGGPAMPGPLRGCSGWRVAMSPPSRRTACPDCIA